jgi:NAD-dependent histone deacetylase SIR2
LLIVIGTSLTVHPFASLVRFVPSDCPRLLINLERVGDFGSRKNDVVCLGQCDDIVKQFCAELGWLDDLNELWAQTEGKVAGLSKPPSNPPAPAGSAKDEVEKVAEEIEKKLTLDAEPGKDEGPSGRDRRAAEVTVSADQERTQRLDSARGVTASVGKAATESVDDARDAIAPAADQGQAKPIAVDPGRTKPIDEARETKADEAAGSPSESPIHEGKL